MRRNISGGAGWRRSGAAGAQDSQSDITDRSARSDHVSEPRRSTPAHTRPPQAAMVHQGSWGITALRRGQGAWQNGRDVSGHFG